MNIITINDTIVPNIFIVDDDNVSLSEQINKLVINVRHNGRNVSCYDVSCADCPLEHLCTDAETASCLREATLKEFFPNIKENFPEYFI